MKRASGTQFGATVVLTLTTALLATAAFAAVDPVAKCASKKLGSTAKMAGAVAKCNAKAVVKGDALDVTCVTKAVTKHAVGYAKAEVAGCAAAPAMTSAQALVAIGDVVENVLPGGHGSGPSKCTATALKGIGKYMQGLLKADAKQLVAPDPNKLVAAQEKALAKLEATYAKATSRGDCVTALDSAEDQSSVLAARDNLGQCVADPTTCDGAAGVTNTATTDDEGDGATASDPIETTVTAPAAGVIAIFEGARKLPAPSGMTPFGPASFITAPPATPAAPLTIAFRVDPSLAGAVVASALLVGRNGSLVADCSGAPGEATPDPCISTRTTLGDGDLEVIAYSSLASEWVVGSAAACPNRMTLTTSGPVDKRRIDIGWKGYGHGDYVATGSSVGLDITCPNATGPDCGTCSIDAFNGSARNCRCENDLRTICSGPATATAECGGNACTCYERPPTAVNFGGVPVCLLHRIGGPVTGSWTPASGAGSLTFDPVIRVHLGLGQVSPCPVCEGDLTANDGARDGICSGGEHDGLTCDAAASRTNYAGATESYSLDCPPSAVTNVTGIGLRGTPLTLGTGLASVPFDVTCPGTLPEWNIHCACLACSGNQSVGCRNDADCVAVGAGLCTEPASGLSIPKPNACGDGSCESVDGIGICAGEIDTYCDGLLQPDGEPVIPCLFDQDCTASSAGTCTAERERRCFEDPLVSLGSVDPQAPVLAGSTCLGRTNNTGVNISPGLPGPMRVTAEHTVTYAFVTTTTTTTTTTNTIPTCGDGVINQLGEECDTDDFGTCSLGCNTDCTCRTCPGAELGGACWSYSSFGASCDDECGSQGRFCTDATRTYAGSDGTTANCLAVLDALGVNTSSFLGDVSLGIDVGCVGDTSGNTGRDEATPTTCEASAGVLARACACQDLPCGCAPVCANMSPCTGGCADTPACQARVALDECMINSGVFGSLEDPSSGACECVAVCAAFPGGVDCSNCQFGLSTFCPAESVAFGTACP